MSCENIVIKDQSTITTITNKNEVIEVVDLAAKTKIASSEDEFVVSEIVGDKITLNATDVFITSSAVTEFSFICTVNENVNDVVYISSSGTVSKANNSSINTAKAIGIIFQKTGDGICRVRILGVISGFSGLIAGKHYFLDNNAGLSLSPPSASGSVITRLGHAISPTEFLIYIDNNYTIRS